MPQCATIPPMFRSSRARRIKKLHKKALQCIIKSHWGALMDCLANQESVYFDPDPLVVGNSGRTALHIACQMKPPLDAISMLAYVFPDSVFQIDVKGQTPLHVAAAWGASPQIIRFLLSHHVEAAQMKDNRGRTPLILACENCCFEGSCDPGDEDGTTVKGPTSDVIAALTYAAPLSVNTEDSDGMSAIEYAIIYGAKRKVVKMLQKASEKTWKVINELEEKHRGLAERRSSQVRPNTLDTLRKELCSYMDPEEEHSVCTESSYSTEDYEYEDDETTGVEYENQYNETYDSETSAPFPSAA